MSYMKYVTACVSAGFLWMFYEAGRTSVKEEELILPQLPEPFTGKSIFFITDIHRRRIPDCLIRRVQEAEIVIVGGDLFEKGVPLQRVRNNIRRLKRIGPVLFVWGNNDVEENPEDLLQLLKEENVRVLENSIYSWQSGGSILQIAGAGDRSLTVDRSFLRAQKTSDPLLLILHDPRDLYHLKDSGRIDAAFAGHTHGGQIRIGRLSPGEPGGWKNRFGFPLLISNGFGTTKLPLRLGAEVQTHLIRLKREEL
ncbi:metallophosphoesterase [Salibacterium sp. K-3]